MILIQALSKKKGMWMWRLHTWFQEGRKRMQASKVEKESVSVSVWLYLCHFKDIKERNIYVHVSVSAVNKLNCMIYIKILRQ